MSYLIGAVLALSIGWFATLAGFDRERGFYPVVTIIIASYYVLFAVMGAAPSILVIETVIGLAFAALALWGFKRNLRVVVVALAAHGIFDALHGHTIPNPGVPSWWPQFCLAYDVAAAVYLAIVLARGRVAALAVQGSPHSGAEGPSR